MSPLAYKILALFIEHTQKNHGGEYGRGYLATWHLTKAFNLDVMEITAVNIKIAPRNEYEQAMRELVDLGLLKEMEDLHERFKLVVKED